MHVSMKFHGGTRNTDASVRGQELDVEFTIGARLRTSLLRIMEYATNYFPTGRDGEGLVPLFHLLSEIQSHTYIAQ